MKDFVMMRKHLWIPLSSVLLLILSMSVSCTETQRKELKHRQSDLVGLKRVVTLYSCNGEPIKVWKGRFKVEIQGSVASFIDSDGKEVKISGTFTVEEMD